MAFRRPKYTRALVFSSAIGLAVLSSGCDGGGPPPSGTQVQDPPPIPAGMDPMKQREQQPPAVAAPTAGGPAAKAPAAGGPAAKAPAAAAPATKAP